MDLLPAELVARAAGYWPAALRALSMASRGMRALAARPAFDALWEGAIGLRGVADLDYAPCLGRLVERAKAMTPFWRRRASLRGVDDPLWALFDARLPRAIGLEDDMRAYCACFGEVFVHARSHCITVRSRQGAVRCVYRQQRIHDLLGLSRQGTHVIVENVDNTLAVFDLAAQTETPLAEGMYHIPGTDLVRDAQGARVANMITGRAVPVAEPLGGASVGDDARVVSVDPADNSLAVLDATTGALVRRLPPPDEQAHYMNAECIVGDEVTVQYLPERAPYHESRLASVSLLDGTWRQRGCCAAEFTVGATARSVVYRFDGGLALRRDGLWTRLPGEGSGYSLVEAGRLWFAHEGVHYEARLGD